MLKNITLAEIQYIAHQLAKKWIEWDEPIPDFSSRYPNILESCLAVPFQTFGKRPLYKGLIGKASVLFYLLIKNHPFFNGNKCIAVTSLLVFLDKNKKWLKVSNQELYNFAMWVASSPPGLQEQTVKAIEEYLKQHIINS
ncbi:type II toxin-antitoxin system death-on-curing family toxin [Candidatus Peregrinibacteria bacterium]|nr:type II toxin-antitoxin system death-on-curing family toxin [Candidatus Peregrinibacteria bacterium]